MACRLEGAAARSLARQSACILLIAAYVLLLACGTLAARPVGGGEQHGMRAAKPAALRDSSDELFEHMAGELRGSLLPSYRFVARIIVAQKARE